ncbi:hypothetical protein [Salipiger aestuarii]|uniref:Uncharacterized protein n=1 Tax=Salipiger aestuarii TaxID=568098 RepID=A0A327YDV6_9RHOB|nr:hypothetical protein [Salipiger aestuarii]EIE50757.1 hypothetical protein C357_12064 [Citreicella sp. 357]KAA8611412.1 hypothetical protein AL037_09530 [Salipiger aestuarii]KAB2542133.1 hypothetical protein AL035_08710 [Salipiger aestuarii]RAK16679.1 hypothetical protein ATI53_101943 [Salipiger aestuarii]
MRTQDILVTRLAGAALPDIATVEDGSAGVGMGKAQHGLHCVGTPVVRDPPGLTAKPGGRMPDLETRHHRACLAPPLDDRRVPAGTTDIRAADPSDGDDTDSENGRICKTGHEDVVLRRPLMGLEGQSTEARPGQIATVVTKTPGRGGPPRAAAPKGGANVRSRRNHTAARGTAGQGDGKRDGR